MVAPLMEVELTEQPARETIREQVKRSLVGQRPGLHDVAHQLRLGARTLQRPLTGEKATFQPLMEEACRQLARHCRLRHLFSQISTRLFLSRPSAVSFDATGS